MARNKRVIIWSIVIATIALLIFFLFIPKNDSNTILTISDFVDIKADRVNHVIVYTDMTGDEVNITDVSDINNIIDYLYSLQMVRYKYEDDTVYGGFIITFFYNDPETKPLKIGMAGDDKSQGQFVFGDKNYLVTHADKTVSDFFNIFFK